MDEGELFIRDAASRRGISEDFAVITARMEGGTLPPGLIGKFDTGWSFWQFQLHYGGPEYPHYGTVAGMGNGFTKLTGWQPGDPLAWKDAVRYALNRVKTGGWGPWYGAKKAGIVGFSGVNRDQPWDASSEKWDYESGATMPTLTYNPDQPPERQVQSWVCSIRATAWVLKSLGLPVDIGALQGEMSPRYVTPDVGLLDGRGYGIAEVLKAHLPPAWHNQIHVYESISWAELTSLAGNGPIALGLHGAYHWINVAKGIGGGSLSSPNPAQNYPASDPIGDTLTEAEFVRHGPASAVFVNAVASTVPADPPSPADPRDARIAELEATVASLRNDLADRNSRLGVAGVDYVRDIRSVATALEALKP